MSDLDDMPELVDSSDGEEVAKLATNLDYVMAWLTSRKKHLAEHHHSIRKCTYGPLLFGFSNNVPKMWITALHDSRVLINKNREKDVTPLSKEEWELTDILTEVFNHANPKMRSSEHLKCALDLVDEVEKQAVISNGTIDVKRAVEKAQEFKTFQNLWNDMSGKTRMKKNSQVAQFCILYVFKNFHYHVLGYGRDGKLIENEIKALWSFNKSPDDAEQSKEKGNKAFKENKFDLAVRWYTQAIKKDPLSHIFFGNRSQAYLKLKKFREALCDGLRAITLDQDWAKGYYRYAEAYFELGMLDKAREINHIGRQACQRTEDKLNLRQIDEQRERFKTEKQRLGQLDKNIWTERSLPDLVSDSNDSDGEEDGVPGLISDSDDNYPPVKSTKLRRKQDSRKKLLAPFTQTLREGSDALEKGLAEVARAAFEKAVENYSSSNFLQKDITESKVLVLKYALGISALATGTYTHIMEAIHRFEEISNSSKVKFPASFYGLGKAYVTLNRYTEATVSVNSGLSAVKNGVRCDVFCWPGTEKVIPESRKDKLEALLKELLQTCKRPPTPDAVCRHGNCPEKDRDVIYFSDPDFKGFVRVNCHSLCVVEFHMACWKAYKGKGSDKEQLNTSCPTPDCSSLIQKICLYRQNSDPKIYVSEKPLQKSKIQKKLQKLELSSQDKISRKAEKKALRKQKRKEARDAEAEKQKGEEEEEETVDSISLAQQVLQDESDLKHLVKADAVLYKKEETEEANLYKGKPKSSKPKKDKKKTKQVLNVEVNFSDRREEQLLGEHSVLSDSDEDKYAPKIPRTTYNSENPFSVPTSLHQKVQDFNSVYDQSINPQNNKHNEVANNLFVYFAELLGEHGPLHVNDSLLTKELEDFPVEAREVIDTYGGLRGFLQQSLKFGLIDNYVCLLKDAVHARSLAMAHKAEYPTLGGKQTIPSDVKTKPQPVKSVSSSERNNVSKMSLNPAAQEFKPQPYTGVFVDECGDKDPFVINAANSCDAMCEIDHLVKTCAAPQAKQSTYNSLDDFTLPPRPNSSKNAEKTLLENMDDIDDFELCADDLEDDIETTNKFCEADWGRESWEGGSDSVSEGISLTKIHGLGSKIMDSAHTPCSIKSDELDPSRCSSRSSHSELGEAELGYRTVSPALQSQVFKSAYSRTSIQKEVSTDVFSSSSFHNSDRQQGNLDLLDTSRKNSLDKMIIPPHPFLSSSSKDAFGSFDSQPSSCDSPLASVSGDAPESVTSIWGSSPTPIFPKVPPFSQDNGFNTFQDRLTNKAQQAVYTPFPNPSSIQIQDSNSSTWSSADGLEPSTASFANTQESYSLFGLEKSSGFSQDHNWLKPKSLVDVEVQTVSCGVSVSTNTDLDINSLFLHYKAMQEQHTQLVATLHKAQEEKISLTAATKQLMLEKMKMNQDQQAYIQQVDHLKQQLLAVQQLNHSLEEKLKQESVRAEEYQKLNLDNREMFHKEKAEMVASVVDMQNKYVSQKDRAIAAEQEYLQLKMQVSLQSYNAAKREATFHHHHVLTYIRKIQEDKPDLPAKVKQILSHLNGVIDTCDSRIADIKTQCEKNIQLIKEGKKLSDLPPFSAPTPPVPMPPEIASMMSQIFGTGSVNSSKLSMRLSPTEVGSKSLQVFQSTSSSKTSKAGGSQTSVPAPVSQPTKTSNGVHNGNLLQPKPIQPLGFGGQLQVALTKPARVPMTTAQIQASLLNSPSLQHPTKAKIAAPQQNKNSFEKLITALQNIFPNYSKPEFMVLIRELRESRGGSLTGMGLDDIVKHITNTVLEREGTSMGINTQTPTAPPPGLSNSWGPQVSSASGGSRYRQLDLFLDEENPCAICHDELEAQETQDLECGHTFHVECIRTWFKEQSTCPNCRVHALLPDDFPTLK